MGKLAAIVGGDATAFLLTMRERFIAADFHLWYYMGIGVSFFFYAVYGRKMYGRFDAAAIALFEEKSLERYLKIY